MEEDKSDPSVSLSVLLLFVCLLSSASYSVKQQRILDRLMYCSSERIL